MVDSVLIDLSPRTDNTHESLLYKYSSRVCRRTRTYFLDYSSNTSLHGVRFIGEPNRTWIERIWWIIMFTICFVTCLILINKVWKKWELSPVFVSFDEKSTPVWQVPFPAVTICSETKFKKDVYNFSDFSKKQVEGNLSESDLKVYADMSLLCSFQQYDDGPNHTDSSIADNMKQYCPTMDDMIMYCMIQSVNKTKSCSTMFTPIMTEEGMCYTFNMLDKQEFFRLENLHSQYDILGSSATTDGWTLDSGYPKNVGLSTYPARGMGYGVKAGMQVLLTANKRDHDFACSGPILGFKILLLNPTEIPRLTQEFFRVPLSQEVVVAVSPDIMKTSDGLRNYEPKRRQCYFQDERYLHYFKVYTQQNCDYECLANYTRNKCGCVHYAMPRDNSTPICSSGLEVCMYKAQLELLRKEVQAESENEENTEDPLETRCDCLPACTSIRYKTQTSQVDIDLTPMLEELHLDTILEDTTRLSTLVIYFNDGQFMTSRRTELYGHTDFLANCGGLLGLCLGFSALSLVEIIYYLTLRIWCNIYMRVNKSKSQLQNLQNIELQRKKIP